MPTTAVAYPALVNHLAQKLIDFDSDTIKAAIATSAYTPSDAHDFFNDITNEVTGTGYTAGGQALTGVTWALTAANSWATARANSTVYALGAVVRPATGNGFLYEAVVAGTSGGSIPTYPTVVGQTVVDGGVTWVCRGRAIWVLNSSNPSWASSTITGRYVIFYVDTAGASSTDPLIAYMDLGADISSTNATWSYTNPSTGILNIFV